MIVTLFGIAAVSLLIFIIAELKLKMPFVDLRLYTNFPFAMGCLIAFMNTLEFRGTNFLLPIMLSAFFTIRPFRLVCFSCHRRW